MTTRRAKLKRNGGEYMVEKIVDQKTCYKIKWKGCTSAQNTWEPEENLNCSNILKTFEEDLKRKKKDENNGSDEFGTNIIRMLGVVSYEAPPKPSHLHSQENFTGPSQNKPDEYLFLCKLSATNQVYEKVSIKDAEEKYGHHVLEYFKKEVEHLEQRNNWMEQELVQATSPNVSLTTIASEDYSGAAGTDEQDSFTSVDHQGAVDINSSSSVSKTSSACNSTCLIIILAHLLCSFVLITMYLFPDRTWAAVGEMIMEIICNVASVIKSWPETLVNSVNTVE